MLLGAGQSARSAGGSAVAAEGAFARSEIDCRIAGIARDDVRQAGVNAVAAACARLQEIDFGKRPRGAEWSLAKREIAAQKVTAASRCCHQ